MKTIVTTFYSHREYHRRFYRLHDFSRIFEGLRFSRLSRCHSYTSSTNFLTLERHPIRNIYQPVNIEPNSKSKLPKFHRDLRELEWAPITRRFKASWKPPYSPNLAIHLTVVLEKKKKKKKTEAKSNKKKEKEKIPFSITSLACEFNEPIEDPSSRENRSRAEP